MKNSTNKQLKTAAQYFKDMREEKGYTQEEIARFLGYKSKQIVSNWERGLCMPPLNKLYELSKILKLPHEDVVQVFLNETELILNHHLDKKKIRA